jgi:hypothetical protein
MKGDNMEDIKVEVLNVFEHFIGDIDGSTYGLYKVSINSNKSIVFRNGNSWGVLSHYLGEPVTKCIGFMRDDRINIVENAINEYLNS